MKTLTKLLMLALLCLIATMPAWAEERGTDRYSYAANPGCQIKITVRAGVTQYPINYRVTYNGAGTSAQGTVDANGAGDVLLPVSHQWYDLTVERAEADKELYKVEVGCDTAGGTQGITAPAPILSETQWATAQQMLTTFIQQRQGSSTIPTTSTGGQGVCSISTRGTIRMRAGHSTEAAVVGNLPRNVQFQVLDQFVETVGKRTRTWYRIDKAQAAPTSDAAEIWVGGTVRTSACGTATGSTSSPSSGAVVANAVLPQAGAWTLTFGGTVNVSCNSPASADFSTTGEVSFASQIASAGSGFTFDGVGYGQDANGTWHASVSAPAVQASGEALIRVDTPTRILGDILLTSSLVPNCTFKIPFWAAPR